MTQDDFRSEMRKIAREALLNDTELLAEALTFIEETENPERFREFLRGVALERSYPGEVAYDDRKLYCLGNPDGSVSPTHVVCEKCGPEHKFELERIAPAGGRKKDWKDCTDRVHELSCAVCGYPERDYEVEVVRIGYGHHCIRLRARHDRDAAEKALDEAGNHLYREASSDYEVNSLEALQ